MDKLSPVWNSQIAWITCQAVLNAVKDLHIGKHNWCKGHKADADKARSGCEHCFPKKLPNYQIWKFHHQAASGIWANKSNAIGHCEFFSSDELLQYCSVPQKLRPLDHAWHETCQFSKARKCSWGSYSPPHLQEGVLQGFDHGNKLQLDSRSRFWSKKGFLGFPFPRIKILGLQPNVMPGHLFLFKSENRHVQNVQL